MKKIDKIKSVEIAQESIHGGKSAENKLYFNVLNDDVTNYITPESFGAKGDGVQDDHVAIQSAIGVAHGNCEIRFRNGHTYLLSQPLVLLEKTILNLNGATLITKSRANIFTNAYRTDEYLGYNGNGNIIIKNGTVIGAKTSFIHGQEILIENIQFKNNLKDHYLEIAGCKNYTIRNCKFSGMVEQTEKRNYVEYIQIDECLPNAFPYFTDKQNPTYDSTINQNIIVEGCTFECGDKEFGNLYVAVGNHGNSVTHENITIRNCVIKGATFAGVRLLNIKNANIYGNDFSEMRSDTGIYIYDCSQVTIHGNRFTKATTSSLELYAVKVKNCKTISIFSNSNMLSKMRGHNIIDNLSIFSKLDDPIGVSITKLDDSGNYSLSHDITKFNIMEINIGVVGAGTNSTVVLKPFLQSTANCNFRLGDKIPFRSFDCGDQLLTIDSLDGRKISIQGRTGHTLVRSVRLKREEF